MSKFKLLLIILLVPALCLSMEISIGGGLQLPLGETGSELPTGSYLDISVCSGSNIKPLFGLGFSTLGLPPSNINLYQVYLGVRYKIFEAKINLHRVTIKEGEGQESENGFGILAGVLIPLGNGGSHANIFYTSIPNGIGIGVVFNIFRM